MVFTCIFQTLQLQFGYADDSNKVTQLSVLTSTAVISKFSSSEGRPSIRADNMYMQKQCGIVTASDRKERFIIKRCSTCSFCQDPGYD